MDVHSFSSCPPGSFKISERLVDEEISLPSPAKITEIVSSVLSQTPEEELKGQDLEGLIKICYAQIDPNIAPSYFNILLKQKIALEILRPDLPIKPAVLDTLILDDNWSDAIFHMDLHIYVGRLISEEIRQVREKFLSFSEEDIKTIVAITLTLNENKKKIKSEFKNKLLYKNKEFKVNYLINFCYLQIWRPIAIHLRMILETLPQKHFTKQEIADKRLPCGRNMLKEFTQRLVGYQMYYQTGLPSQIVSSFLKKEKKQLKTKIKLAIESFISPSVEYQKMQII